MTKHLKKLVLFMLAAVMLMTGAVTAYAEDGVENPYIETIRGASVMGSSPVIFIDTSTGMPAYCIDYNRGIPDPESLSGEFDPMTIFDPDTYRGLEYLLLAGYPFETGGLSDSEAQACTQLAVWCWTGETLGYGLNADNYHATNGREDVYEYFIGLMEAARNQTPPDIGIDCDDIDMVIDSDNLTGTAIVTVRNLDSYSINESVLPEGITVSGYTGEDGDILMFTATLDYAGESITLENLLTGQDTRSALNLFWYDNSNPNQQRMVISYLDETTIAVSAGITLRFAEIPEPESGYIKLIKSASDTQLPLSGAVFGVYDAATDEKLGELVTGEDGTATIELPVCDVYLLELTVPEGYVLSEERIPVTVIGGETVTVTAVNTPIPTPDPEPTEGRIKLIKKDTDDRKLLPNAVFGVYRVSDDVKVCELKTNTNGEAVSPLLPMGDYYLKEITAPASYELSTEKYGVTVKADETVEITVTNKKTPSPEPDPDPTEGKIRLIKKDKDSRKLLSGAVFGVYRASDDVKVCELETNSRGEALSPLLPKGDYYLKELAAPDNYELSSEKVGITVKADETVEITVTNKKTPAPDPDPTEGRIKLIKKDEDDGKLLANAVFGVYRVSDDVKVCEMETTSRGEATSPLLPEGDYYLKELKAPDNYELSKEKYGVTVKTDKTVEITITNPKKPASTPTPTPTPTPKPTPNNPTPTPTPKPNEPTGKIALLKKAEQTGNPLAGAVFGVFRVSDDAKVAELTSGTDGKAELPLAPGDYYLKELKAPYGFLLEKAKIFFTVVKDSTVTVEVTNQRDETIIDDPDVPLGTIEIPKTGESVPYMNYIMGACLLAVSAVLSGVLLFKRKRAA